MAKLIPYLVQSPDSKKRVIRAPSVAKLRAHLLTETEIKVASADDVLDFDGIVEVVEMKEDDDTNEQQSGGDDGDQEQG